jgi:hypothetical protein
VVLKACSAAEGTQLSTTDSSGVYICKSVVNDLTHENYMCKSEENAPEYVGYVTTQDHSNFRSSTLVKIIYIRKRYIYDFTEICTHLRRLGAVFLS